MHISITEHIIQTRKSFRRFGKNYKPSNRAIKAMYHTQENISRFVVLVLNIFFTVSERGSSPVLSP